MSRDHVAHGSPAALREFVAECLHLSAFYASMGVDYASVDDDRAIEVSIKKSVAAMRQAISVMKMLSDVNEAAERERLTEKAARMGAAATLADEEQHRQ